MPAYPYYGQYNYQYQWGQPYGGYSMIDANAEYLDNLRGMLNDERTRDYVKRMIHEAE